MGASRKLVINDSYEFWVHDSALCSVSNFFSKNLNGQSGNIKNTTVTIDSGSYIKSFIYVAHPDYFFDILTWIYSQDSKRLSMSIDEPESFLCLLNLGINLSMQDNFFKTLLAECQFPINEDLFNHTLWSRFSFTFPVLVNLLEMMEDDPNLKLVATLNWLKEDVSRNNLDETIMERDFELLTSADFFNVKKFIEKKNFLDKITIRNLHEIQKKFTHLLPVLDTGKLLDKYITQLDQKIICRVCKRISNNVQDFQKNPCEQKSYHPKSFVNLQRQITNSCMHEGCKKKIVINEYPCCHKNPHSEGCMMSDGQHILLFDYDPYNI